MPRCREVAWSISNGELEVATWRRRFSCWLHLLMCRHCREYRDQIEVIGESARLEATDSDAARLAQIEAEILARIDS